MLFGDSICMSGEFRWKRSPRIELAGADRSHLLDAVRSASAQGKTPSASAKGYMKGCRCSAPNASRARFTARTLLGTHIFVRRIDDLLRTAPGTTCCDVRIRGEKLRTPRRRTSLAGAVHAKSCRLALAVDVSGPRATPDAHCSGPVVRTLVGKRFRRAQRRRSRAHPRDLVRTTYVDLRALEKRAVELPTPLAGEGPRRAWSSGGSKRRTRGRIGASRNYNSKHGSASLDLTT